MKDKHVVVTGAGGSIGSKLCEQIIQQGIRKLSLVSLTESGLYKIERRLKALGTGVELVPILGSVCDRSLMIEVCADADTVIHAAAHKHLPICEANPLAAIENNIRGTLTLVTAAEIAEVKDFILVSTDKAVRPTSVMGSTKRVAEMIVSARAWRKTRFAVVRFGNVLDSDGSVLPLWREQLLKGGPITLTDKRCERYFMSIPEACELILGVLQLVEPGVFVFDMGKPRNLLDMATELIIATGMHCDIEIIGLRPGEKLTEELNVDGQLIPTEHPKVFRVQELSWRDWRLSILEDLLNASLCRNVDLALSLLREMVNSDLRHAA